MAEGDMSGAAGSGGRVLVVDDDADTRTLLSLALSEAGHRVQCAEDERSACDAIPAFRPDVALLDLDLREPRGGYRVARRLQADGQVAIIFVTGATALEDRLQAFDLGADDFVAKPFAMPELLARLGAVLRRTGGQQQTSWTVGDLLVDEERHEVRRGGQEVRLTPTEFDLLVALARRSGRVLSKRQLLADVWGFEAYGPAVVEVRVSDLRRKLEALGPRLIHTVRGVGYVLRSTEASAA
jgi:two-component system OmpR family response regulator